MSTATVDDATTGVRVARGAAYFAGCWVVAYASRALSHPLDTDHLAEPGWWALTTLCVTVVVVGYWMIWPRGTYVLDRRRHPPAVVAYGVVWGLSEGVLFVAVWRLLGRGIDGPAQYAVAFLVLSAFLGAWHSLVYDRFVSPEHNDPAWNGRKVVLCHVPNLALCLAHLAVFDDPAVLVGCQVVALVGSSWFMRFPDLRRR